MPYTFRNVLDSSGPLWMFQLTSFSYPHRRRWLYPSQTPPGRLTATWKVIPTINVAASIKASRFFFVQSFFFNSSIFGLLSREGVSAFAYARTIVGDGGGINWGFSITIVLPLSSMNASMFLQLKAPALTRHSQISIPFMSLSMCCMMSKAVSPFPFTAFTSISGLFTRYFTLCMDSFEKLI